MFGIRERMVLLPCLLRMSHFGRYTFSSWNAWVVMGRNIVKLHVKRWHVLNLRDQVTKAPWVMKIQSWLFWTLFSFHLINEFKVKKKPSHPYSWVILTLSFGLILFPLPTHWFYGSSLHWVVNGLRVSQFSKVIWKCWFYIKLTETLRICHCFLFPIWRRKETNFKKVSFSYQNFPKETSRICP